MSIPISAPVMSWHESISPSDLPQVAAGTKSKLNQPEAGAEQISTDASGAMLLDTLLNVEKTLQRYPLPAGGEEAIRVCNRLNALLGRVQNELLRSGPAAQQAGATPNADTLSALRSVGEMRNMLGKEAGRDDGVAAQAGLRQAAGNADPAMVDLLQLSKGQDPASLGVMADRLAAAGEHAQAIMLYTAAGIKASADAGNTQSARMTYAVHACKSLLALGHAKAAEDALLSILKLYAGNTENPMPPTLRAEINALQAQARSMMSADPAYSADTGKPCPDRPAGMLLRNELQDAWQPSMGQWLNDRNFDLDLNIFEMGEIQHETSQLRLNSQGAEIKANRDKRDARVAEVLNNIDARNKAQAEREKSEEEMSLWGKIAKGLGVAGAVLGVVLAPLTGGLSLLATAYLVVDLALELGEYCSGVKMSIQSGIQIVCEKIVEAVADGSGTPEERKWLAAVIGVAINLVITLVATGLSLGAGAPKLFKSLGKMMTLTEKGAAVSIKVGMGMQVATTLSTGATTAYSGHCEYKTAVAGSVLAASDIQRAQLEKLQIQLDKLFEQCGEDLKLIGKELQRYLALMAEMLWGNIDSRAKNLNALFHRTRVAA